MPGLITKMVECGACIGRLSENMKFLNESGGQQQFSPSRYMQLTDLLIPLDTRHHFVAELFKAGASSWCLSSCCSIDPRTTTGRDLALCKAVIMDGYQVERLDQRLLAAFVNMGPDVDPLKVELMRWVVNDQCHVPSLMRLCRVAIRRQLSVATQYRSILPAIDELLLPDTHADYLKFEGVFNEVDLTPKENAQTDAE